MSEARKEILNVVRVALPGGDREASYAAVPRAYRRAGSLDQAARVELLKDRLIDYDAAVLEVHEDDIAQSVAMSLQQSGETRLLVPRELDPRWVPVGVEILIDEGGSISRVNSAQAVLTACEVAIAETGTIALVHRGAQGRRIDTLLPDHHLIVVRRSQVVETVPEGWRALAPFANLPITTISGPSATSDIEMTRIRGVHGPRRLTVLLVG